MQSEVGLLEDAWLTGVLNSSVDSSSVSGGGVWPEEAGHEGMTWKSMSPLLVLIFLSLLPGFHDISSFSSAMLLCHAVELANSGLNCEPK